MAPLLIGGLLDIGSKLIDRFFPDPEKADAAKLELLKMQQNGELAQMASETDLAKAQLAVNQAEAGSGNVYAASWRPTIGYVVAFALGWQYILHPMLLWAVAVWKPGLILPTLPMDEHIWELMFGMLGLGSMRMVEKIKGKS